MWHIIDAINKKIKKNSFENSSLWILFKQKDPKKDNVFKCKVNKLAHYILF
jgi:hypothetical protein